MGPRTINLVGNGISGRKGERCRYLFIANRQSDQDVLIDWMEWCRSSDGLLREHELRRSGTWCSGPITASSGVCRYLHHTTYNHTHLHHLCLYGAPRPHHLPRGASPNVGMGASQRPVTDIVHRSCHESVGFQQQHRACHAEH